MCLDLKSKVLIFVLCGRQMRKPGSNPVYGLALTKPEGTQGICILRIPIDRKHIPSLFHAVGCHYRGVREIFNLVPTEARTETQTQSQLHNYDNYKLLINTVRPHNRMSTI